MTIFTYYPGLMRIPEGAAPDTKNKSFKISGRRGDPRGRRRRGDRSPTAGGSPAGGSTCSSGKPVFHYNLAGVARYSIAGKDALAPGEHIIVFDFKYDGGGIGKGGVGTIQVDGKTVARAASSGPLPFRISLDETLDSGEDTGTPVSEDYQVPFRFTGDLKKATISLKPAPLTTADQKKLDEGRTAIAAAR